MFVLLDLTLKFSESMEQEKKFRCTKCGKKFKLKSILLLHSMKCVEKCSEEICFMETEIQTDLRNDYDANGKRDCKNVKHSYKDIEYIVNVL